MPGDFAQYDPNNAFGIESDEVGAWKGKCGTYWVAQSLWVDVFEGNWEVDQVQVDVAKSPGFVLCLCHLDGMFPLVVVVPQLGGDEDVLALDKALFDSSLDTLARLLLVLIVVCTIEQTISDFDGLLCVSIDT